jgi:DNA-binding transcriptional MerR regulator
MCIKFRSSGMPLDTIRKYTELVRQGSGNEADRLALLKSHQDHVRTQIEELNECLNVITWKVDIYQQHVDAGTADCLWVTPSAQAASEAS